MIIIVVCAILLLGTIYVGLTASKNETDATASLLQTIRMPDVTTGTVGNGFTCTGLDYDAKEDCWWAGNAGKMLPTDAVWRPTIVKLSSDFTTVLDEINLYEIYPTMNTKSVGSIQGLCVDTSDDTIWFASTQESKVRHVSKSGDDLGGFKCANANGIAYDPRTDTLWVLTRTKLINYKKNGSVLKEISVSKADQDMLFLETENNSTLFTAGAAYNGINYVYRINLSSGVVEKVFDLIDSYCVEGIYVLDETMYIMNDGFYHNGKVPVNQVNAYSYP